MEEETDTTTSTRPPKDSLADNSTATTATTGDDDASKNEATAVGCTLAATMEMDDDDGQVNENESNKEKEAQNDEGENKSNVDFPSPVSPISPISPNSAQHWVRRSTRKRKSILDDELLYSEERQYLQRQQQQQLMQSKRKRTMAKNAEQQASKSSDEKSASGGGGGGEKDTKNSTTTGGGGSGGDDDYMSMLGGGSGNGGYRSSDDENMEDLTILRSKIYKLSDSIRQCKGNVCFFTGAGISRSAGLQTYRGKDGLWVTKKKITGKNASIWFPTLTHRAISVLMHSNLCQYVITQNCDSLHEITDETLSDRMVEIHGNCFREQCTRCGSVFTRDFIISMPTSPTVYLEFLKKQKNESTTDQEDSKSKEKSKAKNESDDSDSSDDDEMSSPRVRVNRRSKGGKPKEKQVKQEQSDSVKKTTKPSQENLKKDSQSNGEKSDTSVTYPMRRRRKRLSMSSDSQTPTSSKVITFVKSEAKGVRTESQEAELSLTKSKEPTSSSSSVEQHVQQTKEEGTKKEKKAKIKLTENDEAHFTGRCCEQCGGKLRDTIVNFGESVPEEDWEKAVQFGQSCDMTIVLGSSLKVSPTNLLAQQSDKLIICNLQRTALHEEADMVLKCSSDTLMEQLIKSLDLTVPDFIFKFQFHLCIEQPKRGSPRAYMRLIDGTTRNIFKNIGIGLPNDMTIVLNRKNKFNASFSEKLKKKLTIAVTGQLDKSMFACKLKPPGSNNRTKTNNDKIEFELTIDFSANDTVEQKIECSLNTTTYQWSIDLLEEEE